LTKLKPIRDKPKLSTTILILAAFMVLGEILAPLMPPSPGDNALGICALVSVPFGIAFVVLLCFLQKLRLQKTRWARFSAGTVVIDMALVFWLFLICLQWVNYWNRLWTLTG